MKSIRDKLYDQLSTNFDIKWDTSIYAPYDRLIDSKIKITDLFFLAEDLHDILSGRMAFGLESQITKGALNVRKTRID
jgi:hypothetical protein